MGDTTSINWCDMTFNGWIGCTKVGPGCDNCYAEARDVRFDAGVHWGHGAPRRRTSEANWKKPLKWNSSTFYQCEGCGWRGDKPNTEGTRLTQGLLSCPECDDLRLEEVRPRVFCASLADVFDNEIDSAWRHDLFYLIDATPNLDWLLLTKRIGNVEGMIPENWRTSGLPFNVWLGATIVNQEEADRDIPKLLSIPAAVHFLSMEPLLGSVDLTQVKLPPDSGRFWINSLVDWYPSPQLRSKVDWVIVGGESGKHAREMQLEWVRYLRNQCAATGIPFLFKQWGEWAPSPNGTLLRYSKKVAGRTLDGKTHTEFPTPGG